MRFWQAGRELRIGPEVDGWVMVELTLIDGRVTAEAIAAEEVAGCTPDGLTRALGIAAIGRPSAIVETAKRS